MWQALSHPNLLELYGVFENPEESSVPFCLVSPLQANGMIAEYLQKMFDESGKVGRRREELVRRYLVRITHLLTAERQLSDVALALNYLHTKGLLMET